MGRGNCVSKSAVASRWGASLVLGSVLCAGPVAAVTSDPWIGIYADGVLAGSLSCGLGLLCDNSLGIATLLGDWTVVTLGGDVITLDGTGPDATMLDPDPQIVYGSTVIDNGAPSTFNFVFSQAIVATAAPGIVSHTLSSNTTWLGKRSPS